jgi:hypothetical protein
MTMGRHPTRRRAAPHGVWLAVLAIAGQVLLPFLIAVEIRVLAEDPSLVGGLDPPLICSHDSNDQPATPKRHNIAACPLCTALAAGHVIPLTTAAILPVPHGSALVADAAPTAIPPAPRLQAFYSARGPPARA